jgi:hypothetical protein
MKGTMLQKDITIIKTHAPNLSAKSSIMKTLQDKKKDNTHKIIVGDLDY